MCDEWKNSFGTFEKFCTDNGWRRGLQIDRIDNNGYYSPENCRFVPPKVNARNRRTNRFLEFNGEKKTCVEWAEII
jgi:hypothetical protein